MPYMDGLETITKIRENFRTPGNDLALVLLHSTSDEEKISESSKDLFINERLLKPVKTEDLYNRLARINSAQAKSADDESQIPKSNEVPSTLRTILVVEDNTFNKLLIKTILNGILPNCNVLEASNGEEALLIFDQAELILMDIQMPVMNGYEAAEIIRSRETDQHVPIIALTAGNVKGEKEKCLNAGMDDFLPKPFVEEHIIQLLKIWFPKQNVLG